jgi:hypothetical protein
MTTSSYRVTVEVELDDPEPQNALTWLVENRFARVPGFTEAEVTESYDSSDTTVPGDQVNKIQADFVVSAQSEAAAASLLATYVGHDMVAGIAVDGNWLPELSWVSQAA